MYKLHETGDHDGLQVFFARNGLELSAHRTAVKCWEARNSDGERIAGLRLEKRGAEYVIAGIAVEKPYRKQKTGSQLLEAAVAEIKRRGGKSVLLVAKAPGFFKKAGFTETEEGYAEVICCGVCPQLNNGCNPSVMRLNIG